MHSEGTFWQGSWCSWRVTQAAGDSAQKLGWDQRGEWAGSRRGGRLGARGGIGRLPPYTIPSTWINWFGSEVSCTAFCPLNHLEIWLCLLQPWWYPSLIPGTTSTGSLAAIPMALSTLDFTSASSLWALLDWHVAQRTLIVLQKQRLEWLFGAAEAQSAPHLCPVGKNAP